MLSIAETSPPPSFSADRIANQASTPGRMLEVLARQPLRRLARHEHLFHEGDCERSIYFVERGVIRLYKILNDGRRQIISFRFPGDVLGSDTLSEQFCSAEAVTEVSLRGLSREAAHRRMKDEPAF